MELLVVIAFLVAFPCFYLVFIGITKLLPRSGEPYCYICRRMHDPESDPFCRVIKWQYLNKYPGKKRRRWTTGQR